MSKELFQQFESEIAVDGHSLRAAISRSRFGKTIIAGGPMIIEEIGQHLQDRKPRSETEGIEKSVKYAWGILLSWVCDEYKLDRQELEQSDFNGWVRWANDFKCRIFKPGTVLMICGGSFPDANGFDYSQAEYFLFASGVLQPYAGKEILPGPALIVEITSAEGILG
jgi:hypothetical protein